MHTNDQYQISDIDSFYSSRIIIYITDIKMCNEIELLFTAEKFDNYTFFSDFEPFLRNATLKKHDLVLYDLRSEHEGKKGYDFVEMIRKNDSAVSIITISQNSMDMEKHLALNINQHFTLPYDINNIIRASKKALGDKFSHEIGMQFFDALFGMQMCTHRDLHKRTFDHVVRTTKIYGKFLLYLNSKGRIELTSWILKNCLMASLLHDIGKLLVMHGVLYKEGKLSNYEYEQVKQHPWNSITALLGGQDIDFFADLEKPIETVSGYKERNIGDQAQKWIFKIMEGDMSALEDVDNFFSDMIRKPSIHSLNKDLLYIVFRHHDAIDRSYHSDEDLQKFGKVLSRDIHITLSEHFPLDIMTNALTICDIFDALLDTKRDYRKSSYQKFFALFLLYGETQKNKFFPLITEEFIKFIVDTEEFDEDSPFYHIQDAELIYKTIVTIYANFNISREKEWEFDRFMIANSEEFESFVRNWDLDLLEALKQEWQKFFEMKQTIMLENFIDALQKADLLDKPVTELSKEEHKTFSMLYDFYFSYSSAFKQNMLIKYLIDTVIDPHLDEDVKNKLNALILSGEINSRKDVERVFMSKGYKRNNIFEVFKHYDEDILINELNDYIRRSV